MVKIVVGMMGSSVASGSSSMNTPDQVQEFLNTVKSHSVRELDTARVYNGGRSEELLGLVDASAQFAVSTKAPAFSTGSLSEANILENCRKSLQALKVEKVDIYYLHGPDRSTPLEEQCRAIGKLYKEGNFDRFGVSNIRDDEVQSIYDICKREGYVLPSVYQGGYSPLHRKAEDTLFPLLRKLNMSFYAFSPLAGGLLAKNINDILKPAKGSRFDAMPAFGDLFLNETIIGALKKQTELCQAHGMSIMEGTLRWFVNHSPFGENDGVILGASTKKQIDASLSACEGGSLPKEVARGFEDMWGIIRESAPGYAN